ncbi:MAG: glutaredoxin family protein [Acidobacteria bacterium]|nr:glutaredoxin family protein [Acidobacteriota bacterium]
MTTPAIVMLYSKPGCHLCDDVRERLEALRAEGGFTVDDIDITKNPALFERYRYEIPVVFVDGVEIGRGRIEPTQLRERLRRVGEVPGPGAGLEPPP